MPVGSAAKYIYTGRLGTICIVPSSDRGCGITFMQQGIGVVQRPGGTIRLPESFKKAIDDEGSPEEFWEAVDTTKIDVLSGVERFTNLAEAGSAISMYMLGDIYFWSYKGLCQGELGMKWLQRAARKGSIEAIYQIGRAYKARRDEQAYASVFNDLSERGFSPAMFQLGGLYQSKNNLDLSEKFYRLGSRAGNFHARKNLNALLCRGKLGLSKVPEGLGLWITILRDYYSLMIEYPESDAFRGAGVRVMRSGIDPVVRASLLLIA